MSRLNGMYFPIVLMMTIFFLLWLFLFVFRKYYRIRNLRLPFTGNLLRSPGQSLSRELDHLNDDITQYALQLCVGPLAFYATYISYLYFNQQVFSLPDVGIVAAPAMGVIGYSLFKLARLLPRRRLTRLGYDGEVAVGQELNQLLCDGYHVYHDFPADKFNIDHVVVGNNGVFAIETKARSKPNSGRARENATVEYNGRVLHFPKWTDAETLDQAERQALWLSKWLAGATGEPVAVRGIVALLGWFVKRTSADGMPVVNPKQFPSLLRHIQPREPSDERVKRIVHQFEQKCRDVAPTSTITEDA